MLLIGALKISYELLFKPEINIILKSRFLRWYLSTQLSSDEEETLMTIRNYYLPADLAEFPPNAFMGIDKKIGAKTLDEVLKVVDDNRGYASWLAKNNRDQVADEWAFTPEELETTKIIPLKLEEVHYVMFYKLADINGKWSEEEWEKIYQAISQENGLFPDWTDRENISQPFLLGAENFGYEKMFDYINRPDISRHDALHAFSSINDLGSLSELSPDIFYSNILQQVKMDSGNYSEGTSYHRLNTIAQILSLGTIRTTLEDLENFGGSIDKLKDLAGYFNNVEDVFASWRNLKKFYEVHQLLKKREMLEQLAELKAQGQEKLYHYVETLAFHETSDVSPEKVIEFWQDPEHFLDVSDAHSGDEHERKKPSNYTDIPNLDLNAAGLRDALVEGDLDKLQAFKPFEIAYQVDENDELVTVDSRERLKRALGSRRDGIVGLAINPGKLFSGISKLFKEWKIDLQQYLMSESDLSTDQVSAIEELLSDQQFGLPAEKPAQIFRAKIFLKSDPEGVVAGNDTACCMPFGSGKNNVYTFNPVCSMFSIQRYVNDRWRTVCQSVLTEDRDVKRNIGDIVSRVTEGETPEITEILPEDLLEKYQPVVTADNVEVAPNFKSRSNSGKLLESIYRDFFAEYIQRYAPEHAEELIIGQGYSDAMTHLPTVENTFLPVAPVAYSDNYHKNAYKLNLVGEKPRYARQIIESPTVVNNSEDLDTLVSTGVDGLDYLGFADTLEVAYLEGKAYADNQSLITYLHNLENGLIAKDINNLAKDRPNMSLKWRDENGKTHGYILAYQGERAGEPVVYISDLASDKESRLVGGNLIKGFVELYRKNYIEKDNPIPIFFEGREQTSYAIVVRQLQRISRNLGIELEMEEGEPYREGGDTMHPVTIRVKGRS